MSRKIASWWKKQTITMKSAIVGALIGGIFTVVAVLLPNSSTVVLIAPTLDNFATPILPPFTPIASTKTTPIVITPYNEDIDSELLAAWENSQLAPNVNNNVVEELEHSDTKIILQVQVAGDDNNSTDWRISSKKLALELLAAYTASLFENQEIAEHYFVRGSIEQAYFDDNSKTVTIRFVIQLKEE